MTAKHSEPIYCSVDLEFTGFDPSRDQILEIGFAFFKVSEQGIEITEQWSQVFKPSIEVHPKILGLTGITLDELESAPEFNEFREFIQDKLGPAIIVGHNPTMDVKFLESYGIKLSGKTIDTLELVQFLLPTHHSYNLENLMHYFGIAHENAHRALGDALSTIAVLENLLGIYQGFDRELQDELVGLCNRGSFLWQPLLDFKNYKKSEAAIDSLPQTEVDSLTPFELSDDLITIDTEIADHAARLALGLQSQPNQKVLVVEQSSTALSLWKNGLVHGLFSKEDLFDAEAFIVFQGRAQTQEELRFCMKVVVWKKVNWQTDTVLDLNISFFGGQFRQFIVGGQPKNLPTGLVCCDYKTFQQYSAAGLLKQHRAVISNLQAFEKYIGQGNSSYLSWTSLLYQLRLIYNPETDYGNSAAKQEVVTALAGADLFFALVYMLLNKQFASSMHVSFQDIESDHDYIYNKIIKAAEALKDKLLAVGRTAQTQELDRSVSFLEEFFKKPSLEAEGIIRWVTLDEFNTSFHKQPLEVADMAQNIFKQCESIQFTDNFYNEDLLSFYVERLGLNTVTPANKAITQNKNQIQVQDQPGPLTDEQLIEAIKDTPMPVVVAMPDPVLVKAFYDNHYIDVKKSAALFAQGYSGGGNKMFRNFSIKPNSILLATPQFISKQKYGLKARTIIFTDLPNVNLTHPYTQALINRWQEKYPNFERLLANSLAIEVIKQVGLAENVTVITGGFELEV